LALGTAIENACIAATARGYRVTVSYFPNSPEPTLVALLILAKEVAVKCDPLSHALPERATNRKPYSRKPLQPGDFAMLLDSGKDDELGEIKLLDDRPSIDALAATASLHDELMFSVKGLHDYIFWFPIMQIIV
ncbi:MAG: hypothetical protein US66_C0019G0001, partial [Candidatus Moranbacteria bacterium GW2011_GWD2_37_9]